MQQQNMLQVQKRAVKNQSLEGFIQVVNSYTSPWKNGDHFDRALVHVKWLTTHFGDTQL